MNHFNAIDTFFDKLSDFRGIHPLNKHILHLLLSMENFISLETQKFLCLCFSLFDDGNACIPLKKELFLKRWQPKWAGLLCLKDKSNFQKSDYDDFEEISISKIIDSGIEDICENKLPNIITPKKASDKIDEDETITPLIFSENNGIPYLFLTKYFVAKNVIQKAIKDLFSQQEHKAIEKSKLLDCIESVKSLANFTLEKEQAEAIIRGQEENLLITGGPGTGKTTVILFILWKLLSDKTWENPSEKINYSIYLAASSGKAANRMEESLKNGLKNINTDNFLGKNLIKTKIENLKGTTIHRLLKFNPQKGNFFFNKNNQFDNKSIFVIDEASMIDINLFASLLSAIPPNCHIFILGDPYQLPSVDAGAVLEEILQSKSNEKFTQKLIKARRLPTKIFELSNSIKNYADSVKENPDKPKPFEYPSDIDLSFPLHPLLTKNGENKSSSWVFSYHLTDSNNKKEQQIALENFLKFWVKESWYNKDSSQEYNILRLFQLAEAIDIDKPKKDICNEIWEISINKKILTAEKQGIYGTFFINKTIENIIRKSIHNDLPYFPGQLLIITENQEMYNIYNGDTGIVIFKENIPYLMVKKNKNDSELNFVFYPLSLLKASAIESAFAITVHKSQGSEYKNITLFLPQKLENPLLNNQILYTGITRAKETITIIANKEIFEKAVKNVIIRNTII